MKGESPPVFIAADCLRIIACHATAGKGALLPGFLAHHWQERMITMQLCHLAR
jgi:hypothetical protein